MKILFLGGAGAMAVSLLDMMSKDDTFTSVVIADLNAEVAAKKADEYGDKFTSIQMDANDQAGLVEKMSGFDLVVSFVGPYYRFERPVAQAAIDAGVHYISIADDYDAYLEVEKLEEQAKAKGIKVMTGMGNSPGLTQLLSKRGYLAIEKPEGISINWAAGSNEDVGRANILHLMHLFTGKTLQWRNGHEEYVPCGGGEKLVHFPEPVGSLKVFYTGHAESVTLPRILKGLKYVSVHGGVDPVFDVKLVRFFARLGLTKTHRLREIMFAIFKPIIPYLVSSKSPNKSVGRVEVWGTENGREKQVYYTYVGHIAFISSAPCFLAARWLAQGKFDKLPGGVYAPERLVEDPVPFLKELEELGIEINYFD
jgi:saccharopine dehydrogenase-like NADP-dependent oxidoreductase